MSQGDLEPGMVECDAKQFPKKKKKKLLNLFSTFSFFFLNFYFLYCSKKKKKKLFFPLLVHTYCYTFSNIFPPFLPFYFFYYSLLFCYTSFIIFSFLYFGSFSSNFILYKFEIIFHAIHIYFSHSIHILLTQKP